jgi:hypothetical protein
MSTHEPADDEFGFGGVRNSAKERIKQIKPTVSRESIPDMAKIDAIADSAGFVSREVLLPVEYSYPGRRASRTVEPRSALNMRVPVSVGVAFQRFCEENRYSYPEALAEIMRMAGLPLK